MGESHQLPSKSQRFRVNPVEMAIFSIVALIFLNSVYKLFYDWKGLRPASLSERPKTVQTQSERLPASVQHSFVNLEFECDTVEAKHTQAAKFRLTGSLCGTQEQQKESRWLKTEIVNTANNIKATVFNDIPSRRFLTDYVPLRYGDNMIQIKFVYVGGSTATRNLRVVRKN